MAKKQGGLAVGDTVKLKSGGPKMTVHDVDSSSPSMTSVTCKWFAGSKLQYGIFNPETLELAPEEKPRTQ